MITLDLCRQTGRLTSCEEGAPSGALSHFQNPRHSQRSLCSRFLPVPPPARESLHRCWSSMTKAELSWIGVLSVPIWLEHQLKWSRTSLELLGLFPSRSLGKCPEHAASLLSSPWMQNQVCVSRIWVKKKYIYICMYTHTALIKK